MIQCKKERAVDWCVAQLLMTGGCREHWLPSRTTKHKKTPKQNNNPTQSNSQQSEQQDTVQWQQQQQQQQQQHDQKEVNVIQAQGVQEQDKGGSNVLGVGDSNHHHKGSCCDQCGSSEEKKDEGSTRIDCKESCKGNSSSDSIN